MPRLTLLLLLPLHALAQGPAPVSVMQQKIDLRTAEIGTGKGPHGLPPVAGLGPEVPYDGGPVPAGHTLISRPRTNLIIGSELTFALSFFPFAVVSVVEVANCLTLRWIFDTFSLFGHTPNDPTYWSDLGRGLLFLVPVAGPLYAISAGAPSWAGGDSIPWPVYAAFATVQGVSFITALLADHFPVKLLRKGTPMDPVPVSWQLVPAAPGALGGASVVGRF